MLSSNFSTRSAHKLGRLTYIVKIIQNVCFISEGHECRSMEKSDVIFDTFRVLYVMTEWSKMTSEKYRYGVACGARQIKKMAEMLTKRGFIPYDVSNNQQLDPIDSINWKNNDIYWKHKSIKS